MTKKPREDKMESMKPESETWIECEMCGERKPDVERRRDPYLHEIHGEIREVWWCQDCYDDRAGDI